MLTDNKKKQTLDTCNNMDQSQKYYAKWKKPNTKGYILYDSVYFIFMKRQNYGGGNHICGCQDLGAERRDGVCRGVKELFGMMEIVYI